ncbi:hypothetical protein DQ384_36420 [Sphaerisporangium album]|uniref:Uncharacterized protein n=1 Tax=Sphaerisporangium album TaxID=509200 RepID=A0A367EX31_9ACTN|nr:hypothetical protein [Sphaerisporangium album]RCG21947.1 hypothetical protein DQ384_36420 [Sphaerisporangium album]
MGLTWGHDLPARSAKPDGQALAERLMDALGRTACTRTDLYGTRALARAALRRRRRGLVGWLRHRRWRPFVCACGWWHLDPRGRRRAS